MKGYKSFSVTVRGAAHVSADKVCQDASLHYSDEFMEIAIVADGHGGDDYFRSDVGARIATEVALRVLKETGKDIATLTEAELASFKNSPSQQYAVMARAKREIVDLWRREVHSDYAANPFSKEDMKSISSKYVSRYENKGIFEWAYGTTLIAAVVTDKCWFAVHIGDGNCIEVYNDNDFAESMPRDPRCVGEASSSLCQSDAFDVFRHYVSFEIPRFIFVHTDGIDDALLTDTQRRDAYYSITSSFVNDFEHAVENVEKNVLTYIATNWKRDDTSLAGIVFTDGVVEQANVLLTMGRAWRRRIEYRRARHRKTELDKICSGLQTTIDNIINRQKELEKEYKKLEERKKELLEIGKKNNDLIEQNKKALDKRIAELEACKKVIGSYDGDPDSEEMDSEATIAPRKVKCDPTPSRLEPMADPVSAEESSNATPVVPVAPGEQTSPNAAPTAPTEPTAPSVIPIAPGAQTESTPVPVAPSVQTNTNTTPEVPSAASTTPEEELDGDIKKFREIQSDLQKGSGVPVAPRSPDSVMGKVPPKSSLNVNTNGGTVILPKREKND